MQLSIMDRNQRQYLINNQERYIRRLQLSNQEKTKHSIEYLGCEIEYFKNYLLSKMTPDMNWHSSHIGHIKPTCAFDLNNHEEFLDCCHYTNFQPISHNDFLTNIDKLNKWNDIDDIFWNENIKGKEYLQLYIPK